MSKKGGMVLSLNTEGENNHKSRLVRVGGSLGKTEATYEEIENNVS